MVFSRCKIMSFLSSTDGLFDLWRIRNNPRTRLNGTQVDCKQLNLGWKFLMSLTRCGLPSLHLHLHLYLVLVELQLQFFQLSRVARVVLLVQLNQFVVASLQLFECSSSSVNLATKIVYGACFEVHQARQIVAIRNISYTK